MTPVLLAASCGLDIKWVSFLQVFVVTLVAAVVIAGSYSAGLRLRAVEHGSAVVRAGAAVCFAIGIAAVLFGLWLVIPQFHS